MEVLEFAEIAGGINSASVGGGRGVYALVDGDDPLALFARVTPDILGQADLDDDAGGHNSSVENCCDDAVVGAAALEHFIAVTWNACGMEPGLLTMLFISWGKYHGGIVCLCRRDHLLKMWSIEFWMVVICYFCRHADLIEGVWVFCCIGAGLQQLLDTAWSVLEWHSWT